MVKGISRQVIVLNAPEPKMFEQAIFILKDSALKDGITDDMLLKEAQKVIRGSAVHGRKHRWYQHGAFWAMAGSSVTGLLWLLTVLL